MDNKVALAVQGFIALTPAQRTEFINLIDSYNQGTPLTQERIVSESLSSSFNLVAFSGGCVQ